MKKLILGTDWWTDCDDAVALRLLTRAHKAQEIELCGIVVNACMEYSIASIDAFLTLDGVDSLSIPIGIDLAANDFGGNPSYQKGLSKFAVNRRSNADAEDALRLYRRLLSQETESVELVDIGFPQVLAALLESGADEFSPLSGIELVKSKVSHIWMMAGKWDADGEKENNFCRNDRSRKAAEIFCRLCPVPVTFLGWEVGFNVLTGDGLAEGDHLRDVLIAHGSENGRHSWDPMLVMLALGESPEAEGYRCVQGSARVEPAEGRNYFTPNENGLHRYVVKTCENAFYRNRIQERIK